jgi:hypothetical protein
MNDAKTFPTKTMTDVAMAVIKKRDDNGGTLGHPAYFEVDPAVYAQLLVDLMDYSKYGDGPVLKAYAGRYGSDDSYRPNVLHAGAWVTPKQAP